MRQSKGCKKYQVLAYDEWLSRNPEDPRPLVTKMKSSFQRGWDFAFGSGTRVGANGSRKERAPQTTDIEKKIVQLKAKAHARQNEVARACYSEANDSDSSGEECPLSTSLDLSVQRSRLRSTSSAICGKAVEPKRSHFDQHSDNKDPAQNEQFCISELPSAMPPTSLSFPCAANTSGIVAKPAESMEQTRAPIGGKWVASHGAPVKTKERQMLFTMSPAKGKQENALQVDPALNSAASFLSPATQRFLQCVKRKGIPNFADTKQDREDGSQTMECRAEARMEVERVSFSIIVFVRKADPAVFA